MCVWKVVDGHTREMMAAFNLARVDLVVPRGEQEIVRENRGGGVLECVPSRGRILPRKKVRRRKKKVGGEKATSPAPHTRPALEDHSLEARYFVLSHTPKFVHAATRKGVLVVVSASHADFRNHSPCRPPTRSMSCRLESKR